MALTESTEDAEQVLFEVFAALHVKLATDFGKTALFDWLIQFTLDTSVRRLIEKNKETLELPHQKASKATLREHTEKFMKDNSEMRSALSSAIAKLPQQLRFVFLLRDVQGMSITKTSAVLGLNVFETRARLHQARLVIRNHFSSKNSDLAPSDTLSSAASAS